MPRLCRGAILFGPNDGGKSNFILALATLRDLVLHSSEFRGGQLADRFSPFCTRPESSTGFEIDVLLEKVRYRYTVFHNAERFILERLIVNRTGKSQRWFERRFDPARNDYVWSRFSSSFTGQREMWATATHSNALYLTTAARMNSTRLAPLFNWFDHGLNITPAGARIERSRLSSSFDNEAFKASSLRLFAALGVPISGVRAASHSRPGDGSAPMMRVEDSRSRQPVFEAQHPLSSRPPIWLDESLHGSGVQRLMELWCALADFVCGEQLTVIDDFDQGLHPLLARSFVQCIFGSKAGDRQAQLLVTSHNNALMDLNVWRRDQIWLAELNDDFESTLTSLTVHHPRKSESIGKAYMLGRYGALPEIRPELFTEPSGPQAGRSRPAASRERRARPVGALR